MADRVRLRLSARDVQRLQQCMAGQVVAARKFHRKKQQARRSAWLALIFLLMFFSIIAVVSLN